MRPHGCSTSSTARVEHILVDEAQDTSPDQWTVVQAIAEDFFAGEGAARAPRTIFAVGDDKQSIFGFQGAAPHMLVEMQHFFERKHREAGGAVSCARPLFLSFRSTREVLRRRRHGVRRRACRARSRPLPTRPTPRTAPTRARARRRAAAHGPRRKTEEPEDWTEPYDAPSAAETALADNIADEIGGSSARLLPSGKRVRDGEILDPGAQARRLRGGDEPRAPQARRSRRPAPTASPSSTHIAVLDLLALADVMLLPDDDLQLAALPEEPAARALRRTS